MTVNPARFGTIETPEAPPLMATEIEPLCAERAGELESVTEKMMLV